MVVSDRSKAPSLPGAYGAAWMMNSIKSRWEREKNIPKDPRAELTAYLAEDLLPTPADGKANILA